MERKKALGVAPPAKFEKISTSRIIFLFTWIALVTAIFFRQIPRELSKVDLQYIWDRWLTFPFLQLPTSEAAFKDVQRLLVVTGITTILLGIGNALLRILRIKFHNALEGLTFSFALGYAAFGELIFVAGLLGLWSKPLFLTVFWAGVPMALLYGKKLFTLNVMTENFSERPSAVEKLCFMGLVAIWCYSLRYALIPQTFYDALEYHLALPNLYLLHGRILPTPENSYSGTPGLPWMLYGWTLALDQWGIVATVQHFSLIGWVAVGIIGCCRRLGSTRAGFIAALVFSVAPVVIGESYRTSVHLEWALMEICWLISLIAMLAEPQGTRERGFWLILTGTFLGFSMCTKYTAWLLAAAMIPAMFPRRSNESSEIAAPLSFSELGKIAVIALAWLAPWIFKNVLYYKNPIYPFFNEIFVKSALYHPSWRKINPLTTLPQIATLEQSVRSVLFSAREFLIPAYGITLSIGLFASGMIAVLVRANYSARERLLAWILFFVWIPLTLVSKETRFFIPHLALVDILLCLIIVRIEPPTLRRALLVVTAVFALLSGVGWTMVGSWPKPDAVFLGQLGYDQYLMHTSSSYPAPPYAGIQFINNQSEPDDRVLFLGETRSFYLQRRFLAASADQPSPLEAWADDVPNGTALRDRLVKERVKFILANFGEIARQHAVPNVSPQGLKNLDDFWKNYTLRVFGERQIPDHWVGVYRILNDDEARQPHSVDNFFGLFSK